jgi:hypothetical protein
MHRSLEADHGNPITVFLLIIWHLHCRFQSNFRKSRSTMHLFLDFDAVKVSFSLGGENVILHLKGTNFLICGPMTTKGYINCCSRFPELCSTLPERLKGTAANDCSGSPYRCSFDLTASVQKKERLSIQEVRFHINAQVLVWLGFSGINESWIHGCCQAPSDFGLAPPRSPNQRQRRRR